MSYNGYGIDEIARRKDMKLVCEMCNRIAPAHYDSGDKCVCGGYFYEPRNLAKPEASHAVLDDMRELIKCSDAMIKILLYDDKIFHRNEMIAWQKQIEKMRAHIV